MACRSNRPAGLAYGLAFAVEPFGSHFSLAFDFARRCEKLSNIAGRKRECRKRMMVSTIRRQTAIRRLRLRGSRIGWHRRSEEHTSELQSLMRISYAVFCLKKKTYRHSRSNTSTIGVS